MRNNCRDYPGVYMDMPIHCGIGYDILVEYEKKNGKIKVGPKWGINTLTGKARKRDE